MEIDLFEIVQAWPDPLKETSATGGNKNANDADDLQSISPGNLPPSVFIYQQQIGVDVPTESYCFSFSEVKFDNERIHRKAILDSRYFNPAGYFKVKVEKLISNRIGDYNLLVKSEEQL